MPTVEFLWKLEFLITERRLVLLDPPWLLPGHVILVLGGLRSDYNTRLRSPAPSLTVTGEVIRMLAVSILRLPLLSLLACGVF